MLQRQVVVRLLVTDGADDAGLAVGQAGDGDAGGLAQRRLAALGGDHEAAAQIGAVGDADGGTVCVPFHRRRRRGEHAQGRQRGKVSVQRHAQAARFDHPAERTGILARVVMVEMQDAAGTPGGRAAHR